jgi:hypothetical protein
MPLAAKQLISHRNSNSANHARQSRVRRALGLHCRHALRRRSLAPPVTDATNTGAGVSNAQSHPNRAISGSTNHAVNGTTTQPATPDNAPPASLPSLHHRPLQQEYAFILPSSPLLCRARTLSTNSESSAAEEHHDDFPPPMLDLASASVLNSRAYPTSLLTDTSQPGPIK